MEGSELYYLKESDRKDISMSEKTLLDPVTGEPEKVCGSTGCKRICNYIVQYYGGNTYNVCRKCFRSLIDMTTSLSLSHPCTITILPMKHYEQRSNPEIGQSLINRDLA